MDLTLANELTAPLGRLWTEPEAASRPRLPWTLNNKEDTLGPKETHKIPEQVVQTKEPTVMLT